MYCYVDAATGTNILCTSSIPEDLPSVGEFIVTGWSSRTTPPIVWQVLRVVRHLDFSENSGRVYSFEGTKQVRVMESVAVILEQRQTWTEEMLYRR